MKLKKIAKCSLATALIFGSVGAISGCKKDDKTTEKTEQEQTYNLYVQYMNAKGETPLTYEQWLASIKGEKGDKGDKGDPGDDAIAPNVRINNGYWEISIDNGEHWTSTGVKATGDDGDDGHTPVITIGDNGNWEVDGTDTGVKAQGDKGNDGTSYYVHIKYADERPTSYSTILKNYASAWMGIYTGTSETAPATYSSYTWYNIKGEDAQIPNVKVTFEYSVPEALTSRGIQLKDIYNTKKSYHTGDNGVKFSYETIKASTWLGVSLMRYVYSYIPDSWYEGWFIKGTNKEIDEYTCIGSDITVEIRWNENQINADLLNSELYTYGSSNNITGYTGESTDLELPSYYVKSYGLKPIEPVEEISSLPSNITSLKISRNITYINVRGWPDLTNVIVDKENTVYDSRNNCNAVIETATNKLILGVSTTEVPHNIVEIGSGAFVNSINDLKISKNIVSLTIGVGNAIQNLYLPSTLEKFDNSSEITNIYFSGTIEEWAEIKSLQETRNNGTHLFVKNNEGDWKEVTGTITIKNIKNIGKNSFAGLSISQLEINEGVETIGANAFQNCLDLTSVTLPSSLTLIGDKAFDECWNIKNVYYNGTVEEWAGITFESRESNPKWQGSSYSSTHGERVKQTTFNIKNGENWEELTQLVISDTITEIKPFAFQYFDITSLEMSDSVISIGERAFEWCDNLETISLSNNLEYVAKDAFYGAGSKTLSYSIYDNGKYIGSEENPYMILVKSKSTSIESIVIHSDTKFMVDYAFYNCSNLRNINLGDNSQLKEFASVFSYCTNLEELTISKHITEIKERLFEMCVKLTTVYYQGTAEEWNNVEIITNQALDRSPRITNSVKYFYSETEPTEEGNYWHYDTDGITPVVWAQE